MSDSLPPFRPGAESTKAPPEPSATADAELSLTPRELPDLRPSDAEREQTVETSVTRRLTVG